MPLEPGAQPAHPVNHQPRDKGRCRHRCQSRRGHPRQGLADQYNLGSQEPNSQVYEVNHRGDRSLTLVHNRYNRKPLGTNVDEMLRHVHRLWGFDVRLYTIHENERRELVAECTRHDDD